MSTFWNLLAFFTSCIIVYAESPVKSVFSLILTFTFVTFFFLQLNVQFATLVLLLVYLGAVIVMFLILVMFINIRIYKTFAIETFTIIAYIFFLVISFLVLFSKNFLISDFYFYYLKWFSFYDNFSILSSICLHLFGILNIEIFLIIFILLISMLSSMSIVFLEIQNLWKKDINI